MTYIDTFNADQRHAHDEVLRNRVTFVNGAGGTGKSYLIDGLAEKYAALVLAPTNAAALNVSGRTLHSGLGIAPGVLDPANDDVDEENFRPIRHGDLASIRSAELLIIDEISMVRADLLDAVDRRLRDIRRSDLPFGGLRTALVGDPYQLRPVLGGNSESERFHELGLWPSPAWYDSAVVRDLRDAGELGYAELFLQERQSGDERFARALYHARVGRVTAEDLEYLNTRHVGARPNDMPALYFQRFKVQEDNQNHLSRLAGPTFRYDRIVAGSVPWDRDLDPPQTVELRAGALVVMTSNNREWEDDYSCILHWVNGDVARVLCLDADSVTVEIDRTGKCYELPAPHVAKWRYDTGESSVYPYVKEQHVYDETPSGAKRKRVVARAFHMPVRVASAMTVHKAQGQTLSRAYVGSGLGRMEGLAYVAVSRLRSLDGLHLERRLSPNSFKVDDSAFEFVTGLQKEALL